MLVDFAIVAMRKGVDRTTAIVDAGRMRARPIVMYDDRDGGRHGAERPGVRRRRRVPLAHGDRGDRRSAGIDPACPCCSYRPFSRWWTTSDWRPRACSADSPERSTSRSTLPRFPRRSPHCRGSHRRAWSATAARFSFVTMWTTRFAGKRANGSTSFERRCDQVPPNHLAVITEDATLTFREARQPGQPGRAVFARPGLEGGRPRRPAVRETIHRYRGAIGGHEDRRRLRPARRQLPHDRIGFILEDAEVKAIVSESRFRSKLADFAPRKYFFDR